MRMRMTLLALACGCCSLLSAQQSTYQSLFDKAMKYVSKDSLQQAESYFMKAMKLEPTNPHNALIFSNIGNIQIRAGERKKAIESYSMALNTMPDLAEAIRQRATLYMQENDYNKAYIDYSHLLGKDFVDFAKENGKIWPGKNECYYSLTVKQIKSFKKIKDNNIYEA